MFDGLGQLTRCRFLQFLSSPVVWLSYFSLFARTPSKVIFTGLISPFLSNSILSIQVARWSRCLSLIGRR